MGALSCGDRLVEWATLATRAQRVLVFGVTGSEGVLVFGVTGSEGVLVFGGVWG